MPYPDRFYPVVDSVAWVARLTKLGVGTIQLRAKNLGGGEALQIVTQVSPDVILTDIAMPGEDGYWLLSEIRRHADGGVSGLPVVAATAYGRDHSRARVLAAGFLDHLPKPVEPEVLWRAIAAAVGR